MPLRILSLCRWSDVCVCIADAVASILASATAAYINVGVGVENLR